jgi:hypothetical protein
VQVLFLGIFNLTALLLKYLSAVFLLSLSIMSTAQSPWVETKGSFYTGLTATSISYTNIFNDDGDSVENTFETQDRTFSLYGSYSISDRTAVIVDLPFKAVSSDGTDLSALGDLKLGIKHELLQGFPLTAYVTYTAPTARREFALRTGYAQHAVNLGLSTGFSKGKTFGYFGSGFQYREEIPNQIIIDTEIGTKASLGSKDLFLIFRIDGAFNLEEVADPVGDRSVLYHNNGSYLSPGIKIGLNLINDLWLNFGTYGAITARNQAAAPSLSLGIAWKYSK